MFKFRKTGCYWRDSNGQIRCLGDACQMKQCDDTCPIWKNTIASKLVQLNELTKALELLDEVIQIAPDFYDAWNNSGMIYGRLGKFSKAYECYRKAHELRPNRCNPIFGLALSTRDLEQYEECLRWCDLYDQYADDHRCDSIRKEAKEKSAEQKKALKNLKSTSNAVFQDSRTGLQCQYKQNKYVFVNGNGRTVTTPKGNVLEAASEGLAKRIFRDLMKFGPDEMDSSSVLPWQYTWLDNFGSMNREQIIQILRQSFLTKEDWTFIPKNPVWVQIFGVQKNRVQEISNWLQQCSRIQLTAACCIGNAYRSLNVAYCMAHIVEKYSKDEWSMQIAKLSDFASQITKTSFGKTAADIRYDFETFQLFWFAEEETAPDENSGNTEFERDISELLERDDLQCRDEISEVEFQKASRLAEEGSEESLHRAYDIMGNLASQFDYVPAIIWMGNFAESQFEDWKQAAFWYKKAADLGSGEGARYYADLLMVGNGNENLSNLNRFISETENLPINGSDDDDSQGYASEDSEHCATNTAGVKDNERFQMICRFIEDAFMVYGKENPEVNIQPYVDYVGEALRSFSIGREFDDFTFSFDLRIEQEYRYLSFSSDGDSITVSEGGSVYDPEIGSDSYTSWSYTFWDTGEEEGFCGLIDFDILDFLHSGARLEIELPDNFGLNSDEE